MTEADEAYGIPEMALPTYLKKNQDENETYAIKLQ
jgi:hypothetical protein